MEAFESYEKSEHTGPRMKRDTTWKETNRGSRRENGKSNALCFSGEMRERKSMRYIAAEVEWYAHGWTYGLQNIGTGASYGLGPTKILYCDRFYRFDRFLSRLIRTILVALPLVTISSLTRHVILFFVR
jgi:hypothetical protein